MKNFLEKIKIIFYKFNIWAVLWIAFLYIFKFCMYINSNSINTDFHIIDMKIDDLIPFCKYFVIFYFSYYWFSQVQLWVISFYDKRKFFRIIVATIITCILSNIVFLCYQVKIIRPEIVDNDFFSRWVQWVYNRDPKAMNCLPSVHVVMGVIMIIAVWKTKGIPKWFNITSIIFGVGCILSTVFIKQHYFIDLVFGVLIISIIYPLVVYIDKKIIKRSLMKKD